ncbi:hypothetical protein KOI35_27470 [Actinoplanes bogorensis]|uniref:Bulb-type lectin domain-containing protein n=1 Tax=Paractinoplanes bogorensis TaxID=1610840 RepID=A0ABS5YUY2_9ACTN|nr:hypothetical protein [Actinoplanes bogorensis]MBU2667255.1 hypothetical protein [Actinoplanes bogorensis]
MVALLGAAGTALGTEQDRSLFLAALMTRLYSEEQLRTLRKADLDVLTTQHLRSAVAALPAEQNPELRKIFGIGGDTLTTGGRLDTGDRLTSPNGRYTLQMQTDGNLVGYEGTRPFWATGTWDQPGNHLVADPYGRFNLLTVRGTVAWTRSSESAGGLLRLQDDRNLVLYHSGTHPAAAWASHTNV